MTISYRRSSANINDASGATVTATYTSNNLGDLGWCGIYWYDPSNVLNVSTVTDGAGNTWSSAGTKNRDASGNTCQIWRVATGLKSSGSNTVTVTLSGSTTFKRLSVLEYKSSNGAWTFDPLDATTAGANGSGTALSSGNMTPASDNDLVAGFGATAAPTFGASSPYTARAITSDSTNGASERILVGGTGTGVAAQATCTSSGLWVMVGALFKDVPSSTSTSTTTPTALTVVRSRPSSGMARSLMAGGVS